LNIARRSLSETQYLIGFAGRRKLIDASHLSELESFFEEVSKMINALAKSIRQRSKKTS
jgi:four helix bundle protein